MEETNNTKMRYLDTPTGVEIFSKRGKREKHFLQNDGSIIAMMYSDDIHFKKNKKYEEIDNTLEKKGSYYKNKNNLFNVYFNEYSSDQYIKYKIFEENIGFEILNGNKSPITIFNGESQYCQTVRYNSILNGIDFEYHVNPTRIKENIIVNSENNLLDKIEFKIHTKLKLVLCNNKSINAIQNNKIIFTLEAPFIIDSNNKILDCVNYRLEKEKDGYILSLQLDDKKIRESNLKFPIIIDPTISTIDNNVYDTFIYWAPIVSNYTTSGGAIGDFNIDKFLASNIVSNGGIGTYTLETSYSVDPATTAIKHFIKIITPLGDKYDVGADEGFINVYYPNEEGKVLTDSIIVKNGTPYDDVLEVSGYTTSGGAICSFDSAAFLNSIIVSSEGAGTYTVKTNISINHETTAVTYYAKVITPSGKTYDVEMGDGFDKLYYPDSEEETYIDTVTIVNKGSYSDSNRGVLDYLKAGVEKQNNYFVRNRSLIKVDLPVIGTGSQVYFATLSLVGNPYDEDIYHGDYVDIHRITSDWDEQTANWNSMNDKFADKIEASMKYRGGYNSLFETSESTNWDITSLVKKWYSDTPNYGVMVKAHNEVYPNTRLAKFYSKNNNVVGDNPKPTLRIVYRNQNGLEDYMNFEFQKFSDGMVYENTYNGNLIAMFQIGETISNNLPASLGINYNTNDVVLGTNRGFGLGFKLNLLQTIKERKINGTNYLEYVDEDGTIHYFVKNEDNDYYIDEDNLGMTLIINDNGYALTDKKKNTMSFVKTIDLDHEGEYIAYLNKFEDVAGNQMSIYYNEFNKIIKIVDADNQEINIVYGDNIINIISPTEQINLNYVNGNLVSIESRDGNISFEYNSNKCISKIIDKDGTKVEYDYYQQIPYRVSNVKEYGIDAVEGTSFNIHYGFNSTTIIDNKGRATTINFNNMGGTMSISDLKNGNDVKNAYSIIENYGTFDQYLNKRTSNRIPIKYVKNYFKDPGFEDNTIHFSAINDGIELQISTVDAFDGEKCLEILANQPNKKVRKELLVPKGENYTFSAYIKNNANFKISLAYEDEDGSEYTISSDIKYYRSDYERIQITGFYPENATSPLYIIIELVTSGSVWIDNMQLENGEVANSFNYIDNSDFSNGLEGWNVSSEDNKNRFNIVTLEDGTKALNIKMDPTILTGISKRIDVKGNIGDKYTISFWYKNKGNSTSENNYVLISPNYTGDYIGDWHPSETLNPNDDVWQFFTKSMVMADTYDYLTIYLSQNDVNEMYVTNFSLYKDIAESSFDYDVNGNVIEAYDTNGKKYSFDYDNNNQLIKMTNRRGSNLVFEYDNIISDRILSGISEGGIVNSVKYDEHSNPKTTLIVANGVTNEILDGIYKIRFKGTNEYLKNSNNSLKLLDGCNNHDKWLLQKADDNFTISYLLLPNKFLTVNNNLLSLSSYNNNSLFILSKNKNGSYYIKCANSDKYIKNTNGTLILADLIEDDYNFEFYFENVDGVDFAENNAEYIPSGKFIKKMIDTDLNEVIYDIDEETGLTKAITDSKGNTIYYLYDENDRLIKTIDGLRIAEYIYDSRGLLVKIILDNKEYNFEYDSFLNTKCIKIGENIVLITNNYENNNGLLLSSQYGNNDIVSFEYDEFDRITKFVKMDDTYNYKYGSNGDVLKIISQYHQENFEYDSARRLIKYIYDNFIIKYNYDDNGNIINKKYGLDVLLENDYKTIENQYDADNLLLQTKFDNNILSYSYDKLGRLLNSSINGVVNNTIEYKNNGHRLSWLVSRFTNLNGKYEFKYDKMKNLTHIFHNDTLERKFYYDRHSALIREDIYGNNTTIRYKYDNSGNILFKNTYELCTYNLLCQNKYEYNENWKDQLIKFNDVIINYDEIGNPISIGDEITITWINGRQLSSYTSNNNIVSYKYNADGIRISKNINGIETKYYVEENNIILETCNNDVLYYIRNDVDDLIAFKFNNTLYYYLKNSSDDIIGILDSDYNLVAKYEYDSWGVITAVLDSNGNDISNNMSHIANINPFRYRSYYYDRESKMYYLNNRYYNPEWGRFINPDGIIGMSSILGYNLYQYAFNNPISLDDFNGSWPSIVTKFVNGVKKKIKNAWNKVTGKNNNKKKPTATKTSNSSATSSIAKAASKVAKQSQSVHLNIATGAAASSNNSSCKNVSSNKVNSILAKAQNSVKLTKMTKEIHYSRNQYNDICFMTVEGAVAAGFHPYSDSTCHNFGTSGNTKYVSADGRREVVFDSDGNIVWDINNIGTYNFSPARVNSEGKKVGSALHFDYDVAPWILWGNGPGDTTTIEERIKAYKKWC